MTPEEQTARINLDHITVNLNIATEDGAQVVIETPPTSVTYEGDGLHVSLYLAPADLRDFLVNNLFANAVNTARNSACGLRHI